MESRFFNAECEIGERSFLLERSGESLQLKLSVRSRTWPLALQHAAGQLLVQYVCGIAAAEQRLPAVEPARQEHAKFPQWWRDKV